jgi:hypothetical protein
MARKTSGFVPCEKHPLWPGFVVAARRLGIELKHPEDWWGWWQMFKCGSEAEQIHFRSRANNEPPDWEGVGDER